jgi:S-adenosylmethionine hydrolase
LRRADGWHESPANDRLFNAGRASSDMIVLFTDFGLEGPYTGQLQAVLNRQAPGVPVVSLFADLAPFDIGAAAYLLPSYAAGFPPGTVFLCVVDPGVGSTRPGVVVQADGRWYVGPNEGLFALLARRAHEVNCWQLQVDASASASFHGRDVFAPAAACLARGGPVPGEAVSAQLLLKPDWPDELWRVAYIDRYGNAITGVRASALDAATSFTINGHSVHAARTFSDVTAGEAFWYENSSGLLEFAVNRGRADALLGLTVGTEFNK